MTVGQLIEKLLQFDESIQVMVSDHGGYTDISDFDGVKIRGISPEENNGQFDYYGDYCIDDDKPEKSVVTITSYTDMK